MCHQDLCCVVSVVRGEMKEDCDGLYLELDLEARRCEDRRSSPAR